MDSADDVLNLARLQEAYEDDRPAIAELLGMACATELRYITALREGIAAHDSGAVARAAHSIKGSASNIGATHLSRIAAEIEDDARRDRWDRIDTLNDELTRRYADLRERVAQYAAAVADE